MSSFLDILFSIVLGAMILLAVMAFNHDMVDTAHENRISLGVQDAAEDFRELLEYDFKRAGLGIPDTVGVFILADSIQVKFRTDIGLNGSVNEIHYYAGNSNSALFTDNPGDFILYRKIDGNTPETITIGITGFKFTYLDGNGSETAALNNIRVLGYSCNIESRYGYNGKYSGMHLRGAVNPKNVR